MAQHPSLRSFAALHPLPLLAALAVYATGVHLPAQETPASGGHPILLDSALSRPHTLTPTSGPAGTRVTVTMGRLPATTPLWLGIGATRSGFEALGMVYTDGTGEFSQVVSIPDWAERDRAYEFIVFDAYFSRLALTRPFDVVGRDGTLQRRGEIVRTDGACPILVGEDGVRYALAGGVPILAAGERVILDGLLVERSSECKDDRSILVTRIYTERRPR